MSHIPRARSVRSACRIVAQPQMTLKTCSFTGNYLLLMVARPGIFVLFPGLCCRLSSNCDLVVPRTRQKIGDRAFRGFAHSALGIGRGAPIGAGDMTPTFRGKGDRGT